MFFSLEALKAKKGDSLLIHFENTGFKEAGNQRISVLQALAGKDTMRCNGSDERSGLVVLTQCVRVTFRRQKRTFISSPGHPNRLVPHAFRLQCEVVHDLAFPINKIEFALAVFAHQYESVVQWLTGQDLTLCPVFI